MNEAPVIVIATRNRRPVLLETLARLRALPERPRVVVVDNASQDGTAEAVRAAFPDCEVIEMASNLGAAARTVCAQEHDLFVAARRLDTLLGSLKVTR